MTNIWRSTLAAVAITLTAISPAQAQFDWPNRPITFLQPYAPGNNLDGITRRLAEKLGAQWKVPIVVENKAGANGVIGTESAARASADGYTWLFTGPGHFTNEFLMAKIPFDPLRDFKPVARLASVMLVLAVPNNSPFHSVRDLIEFAKKNPGKLSYASAGSGSAQHLATANFQHLAGLELLHVPYKTQAQTVTDTLTGEVDFTFVALATGAAQLKAGRLRGLAVTGPHRSQSLPDLPTVAEAGLPGYEFFAFNAVFAPKKTPDEIVRRFTDALGAVMRTPQFAELAKTQGFEPTYADKDAWNDSVVAAERQKWANLIRLSGAKSE